MPLPNIQPIDQNYKPVDRTGLLKDYVPQNLIFSQVFKDRGVPGDYFEYPSLLSDDSEDPRTIIQTEVVPGERPKVIAVTAGKESQRIGDHMLDGAMDPKHKRQGPMSTFGMNYMAMIANRIRGVADIYKEQSAATILATQAGYVQTATNQTAQFDVKSGTYWDAKTGDDYDNDPRDDLEPLSDAMKDNWGVRPNVGVTSREVMRTLKKHTLLRKAFNPSLSGTDIGPELTDAQVAAALELDRIIVGDSVALVNGTRTALWGDNFVAFYEGPNVDFEFCSHLRNSLNERNGSLTEYFDIPNGNRHYLRWEESYTLAMLGKELGCLVKNVLA